MLYTRVLRYISCELVRMTKDDYGITRPVSDGRAQWKLGNPNNILVQREDCVRSGLLLGSGMHVVELMIIMTFGDVISPGIKGPAVRVNITV